ncbi:MAG: hypothetical protein AAF573_14325 [Bacteroidota bacterium]
MRKLKLYDYFVWSLLILSIPLTAQDAGISWNKKAKRLLLVDKFKIPKTENVLRIGSVNELLRSATYDPKAVTGLHLFNIIGKADTVLENIEQFTNLEFLKLEMTYLEQLPPEIYQLKKLKKLIIKSRSFKRLEDDVEVFKDLEVLQLNSDQLNFVSEKIGSLTKLQMLQLLDCKNLKELPASIGHLKNLKSFTLTNASFNNDFDVGLAQLTQLEELSLVGVNGQLSHFDAQMGEFQQLKKLIIFSCEHLFTSNIGQLQQLEELDFRTHTNETSHALFDAIYTLTNLKKLKLKFRFTEDLVGIGQLKNIEVLYLNTYTIPEELKHLTQLRQLFLFGLDMVETLPPFFADFQHLELLRIDGSPTLQEIPASLGELPQLKYLGFKSCYQLKSIAEEIGSSPSLEVLELVNNKALSIYPKTVNGKVVKKR